MILADTSIWIDHLRQGDDHLANLLNRSLVFMHPCIHGEIACGNLKQRKDVLTLLGDLPQIEVATDAEVLIFIEKNKLMGKGIGFIDAHLLAATALGNGAQLWTRDKRLREVAETIRLSYPEK